MTPPSSLRRLPLLLVALLVASLAVACGDAPAPETAQPDDLVLPDWLDRIYPIPGQEESGTQDVQVEHNVTSPDERIYLFIDGTDVTAYVDEGRGELVYDPDRNAVAGPVELDPGQHSATAQRVRIDPETDEIIEVVDEFTWEFTIL